MSDQPLVKLVEAASARATGVLVCEAEGVEVQIQLHGGRITWASDSRHATAFKDFLKEHAKLDDESLDEAATECRKADLPLTETLVTWKLATLEQVRDGLRHQVALALATIKEAASAKAVFLTRANQAPASDEVTLDLREFLPALRSGGAVRPGDSARLPPPVPRPAPSAAKPPPAVAPRAAPASEAAPPPAPEKARPARASGAMRVGIAASVVAVVAVAGLLVYRGQKGGASAPAPAEVPAPSPQAAASSAPGAAEGEIVFGMSGPFSGATRELGRGMRVGIEAAFALANETGGVNGRKVRLVALDDGYDPARTPLVMKELIEERKVFGIVGTAGTPTAAVALPYAMERKALFFGALTGAPFLRKIPPDRYVFNYRASYAEETAAAYRYLLEVRRVPAHQVAFFYQDDGFGAAGLAGVEEVRKARRDGSPVIRMTYKRNSADVREAVAAFKRERARIRAVVMVATYQAAIQFIQQVRDLGANPIFTDVSAVNSNALAEALVSAGPNYTQDVLVTQTVPLPNAKSTAALEYQTALEKLDSSEKPGFISFEGFIVGRILVEGLRRSGNDLSTESVVAALEDLRDLDLGLGTHVGFEAGDHQASHKVWGTMLQPDGSYRSIRLD